MINNKPIHSGSHFKKILSKGSWYFFSSIITKVFAFVVLPITTRLLSKNDIGILDSLESIKIILPLLISLSLDEAYYRFHYDYNKSHEKLKVYVSTYFWVIIGWGIFIVVLSTIFGKIVLTKFFNIKFFPFIPFTMIGPLLLQLKMLGEVYLKQNLKAKTVSIANVVIYLIYYIVFIALLVFPKLGAESKIYGLFVADLLSFIFFTYIIFKDRLIGFYIDFKILFEGLKFSVPLILNQALVWITGLSDRLIIGKLINFSETGLYSVGYRLSQTHTVFSESIFRVYKPIMFSMLKDNRDEAIKRIESFIPAFFFIMFYVAFFYSFFGKEIIIVLTGLKFHSVYKIIPFIVFAYFFNAMYKPFYNIISFHKKTWIFLLGSLIQASFNLIFNFILIPVFGSIAAAWTTFLSFFILFIWLFLWSRRYEKIKIKWLSIFLTILICLIFYGLYLIFEKYFSYSNIVRFFFNNLNSIFTFKKFTTMLYVNKFIYAVISSLIKLVFFILSAIACVKFKIIDLSFLKIKK